LEARAITRPFFGTGALVYRLRDEITRSKYEKPVVRQINISGWPSVAATR
jgi:hypothetical protein